MNTWITMYAEFRTINDSRAKWLCILYSFISSMNVHNFSYTFNKCLEPRNPKPRNYVILLYVFLWLPIKYIPSISVANVIIMVVESWLITHHTIISLLETVSIEQNAQSSNHLNSDKYALLVFRLFYVDSVNMTIYLFYQMKWANKKLPTLMMPI